MPDDGKIAYGCLFCQTGKEQTVADRLQSVCPEVRAVTARQEKFRSFQGKKMKVEAIILPSYVFFQAPADIEPATCFPRENMTRLLTMDGKEWQLTNSDERFVRWLFAYDGLLGFSKAYQVGKRIRIVSGPLKDMEGQILRVDRRGRSGQVMLEFNGRKVPVWLGFDLIDPLTMQ